MRFRCGRESIINTLRFGARFGIKMSSSIRQRLAMQFQCAPPSSQLGAHNSSKTSSNSDEKIPQTQALIYSAAAPERRPGAQQQPVVDNRLVSPCQSLESASTGALRQRSASPPGSGRAQEGSQEGVHNEGVQQQIQGAHREESQVGGAAAGEIEVAIVPAASAEPGLRIPWILRLLKPHPNSIFYFRRSSKSPSRNILSSDLPHLCFSLAFLK